MCPSDAFLRVLARSCMLLRFPAASDVFLRIAILDNRFQSEPRSDAMADAWGATVTVGHER